MNDIASIQDLLRPVFPGLLGMELTGLDPDRLSATLTVRPDPCTVGGILHGGAGMAFADTWGRLPPSSTCRKACVPRPSNRKPISLPPRRRARR